MTQPADVDLNHAQGPRSLGGHPLLGTPLARLEGEIAFQTLIERFPDLVLAENPQRLAWRRSTLIHGVTRLPVRL